MLITRLKECGNCGLRYRVPTDTAAKNRKFYQEEYEDGFSGQLPSDEQLEWLLGKREIPGKAAENWQGRHKEYIKLLLAAGVPRGARVLDYGCSWGWGAHVLRDAGFEVSGYEISAPRSRFARDRMSLDILARPDERVGFFDAILASHVLEHLPAPNILWAVAAKALKRGGTLLILVPNGNEACRAAHGPARYASTWGQVHPLMITSDSLRFMASNHGFSTQVASEPYDLERIARGLDGDDAGMELCCIARKMA